MCILHIITRLLLNSTFLVYFRTLGEDSSPRSSIINELNVQELEMLLEAYFVQIDGTLNNLSNVRLVVYL